MRAGKKTTQISASGIFNTGTLKGSILNRQPVFANQSGMTLVEVMAVLFIIGLTAGMVTLTLPQRPTPEQASAQAFAKALRDGQEHAIIVGQPVGVRLLENGYAMMRWRQDDWRPQGRPTFLPSRMTLSHEAEETDRPGNWPEIVFDPTGVVEPLAFQLRSRGVRIDIFVDENGEVQLVER